MTRSTLSLNTEPLQVRGLAPSMLMLRIVLCLVGLWAIYGLIFFETRRHAWNEAVVAGANMATLVESAIAREIELYDLSVRAAAEAAGDPSILALPIGLKRKVLFDDSNDATMRGRMVVIDADGRAIAVSRDNSAVGLDYSDRDYFKALRVDRDAGLYIGGPFAGRITHELSIGLARRRPDVSGRFDGVVVGTIQLDFFTTIFKAVHLPPGGSITLLKSDGTIMTRVPFQPEYVGRPANGPTAESFGTGARTGAFRRFSATDGVERLFSFRRVAALPLFVNVGFSVHQIFDLWRWEMLVLSLGFGLLTAIIVTLGLTLAAELQRRSTAERRLSDLACTDHLTSLANRRHFDDVLDLEWRRAARSEAQLSLLMVDCDHFKSFNDTYGHPAGDSVLRAIATALQTCVDRPGDLVARFGGEEFAVLLPGTDEAGAMVVATALRAAVDALDLAHAVTPTRRLTVSVGLASLAPTTALPSAVLVDAADAALYCAKREGRDRIVRHNRADKAAGMLRVA